jgi:hypothetical protein
MSKDCRDDSYCMVLGYIPNLGYGKENAKKQTAEMHDEHICLSLITNQMINIHDEGGFLTEVMG